MGATGRGRAGAVVGVLAGALLVAGAAAPDPVRAPSEPPLAASLGDAPGTVAVFPAPGTPAASPASQVTFRGVDAAALGPVTVRGSRSGPHDVDLLEHSDGDGVSVVPREPFAGGERVTVTTDLPVRGARDGGFGFTVAVPRPRPPLGVPPVRDLPADQPVRRYVSAPHLQPPVVEVTRPVTGAGPGLTAIGVKNGFGQKGPMLVDDDGEPVWFRPLTGVDARDVKVQRLDGRPVVTWWEGRQPVGFGYGEVVVVDAGYREVARFGMGNGYDPDSHEVLLTPEGTALLMAYEPVAMDLEHLGGPRDGVVLDNVVQEVDLATGAVLFEWHSLGTVGLAESYLDPAEPGPFDYAHINSIGVDDDGDLLVSARHTCAVYSVDRTTGSVEWRLGGRRSDFRLAEDAVFLKQHDARRSADGTLTLFDNGGTCGDVTREHSRGIALRLDEERGTAELVREHVHPDRVFAESQGSYQELADGDVLLGWGSVPRWTEMTPDGTVLLDAAIPDSLVVTTYRAYRAAWTAAPAEPPAAVLARAGDRPAVHVSWNGATEVAVWRVVTSAVGGGEEVARAGRTGFETVLPVPVPDAVAGGPDAPPLVVQALDDDGEVLGTAPVRAEPVLPGLPLGGPSPADRGADG